MAAVTSLATFACCLPMGFAAAAATASLSMAVAAYQPWFLGASVVGRVDLHPAQNPRPFAVPSKFESSLASHRLARIIHQS